MRVSLLDAVTSAEEILCHICQFLLEGLRVSQMIPYIYAD